MVTIGNENRLFGADSFLESGKYPATTFSEMARTFGQMYDEEYIAKFKKERFIYNDIVPDERGFTAWKIMRPLYENETGD